MDDQDYPGLFQSSNKAAATQQKWHFIFLKLFLSILFAGACLSLFPSSNKLASTVAAIFFGLTIGITLLIAYKRFDKSWFNARAVAESVKTRTWRYMMRAEPYNVDDVIAASMFAEDLDCILKENGEAIKVIPATRKSSITGRMVATRGLSLLERKDFYKQYRVDEQLDWYIKQTEFNKDCTFIWFCLLILFQVGALICVIAKLNSPKLSLIPTNLFTTLVGVGLSWTQAKRFGELSTSYNMTAHEISIISSNYRELSEEQRFTAFVRDSEAAFSREHTQWIARRGI